MKLREFNLNIFLGMLDSLHTKVEIVKVESAERKQHKGNRDDKGWSDWYTKSMTTQHRSRLEEALEELRYELATCYDFMHERGLVEHEVAVALKDKLKEGLDALRQEVSRLESSPTDYSIDGSARLLAESNGLHPNTGRCAEEVEHGYPV